jgi:hypothetical protein
MKVWKSLGMYGQEVNLRVRIRESNGPAFKKLVFSALVSKYLFTDGRLPCAQLGLLAFETRIRLNINNVYTATCTANEDAAEIGRLQLVAANQGFTVLNHCSKNSETIDFCVLSRDGVIAMQVSLQSLTNHERPCSEFLRCIGAFIHTPNTRSHDWLYVYTTMSLERHPLIAAQLFWYKVEVSKIRIVDATCSLSS